MAQLEVQKRSGGPFGGPGGFERTTRRSRRAREALPEILGWVERPTRRSRSGWEAHLEFQVGLGGPT